MGDDSKKSVFNAGVAFAERIDGLRRAINTSKYNPIAYNQEVGKFNYEIMLASADILLDESWGKLTPKEREEGDKYSKILNKMLKLNPIIVGNNREPKIDKDKLDKFMELFTLYERKIRIYYEAHDIDSPNKEQEDDDEL